ncbi:MAG: hypothetical protein R2856_26390 [Caldilineaceae bacterium]
MHLAWTWIGRSGWSTALRMMGLGVTAVLFLLTVRHYRLAYANYDMATEY